MCYLPFSKNYFDNLRPYNSNEIDLAPLYYSLMRLIRGDLPFLEVLCDVDRKRIENDLYYLIEHGVVAFSEDKGYQLTKLGHIVSRLPLSVPAGKMIASAILDGKLNEQEMYHLALTACYLDYNGSLLYYPNRKPRESVDEYNIRRAAIIDKQSSDLITGDSIASLFFIWHVSFIDMNEIRRSGANTQKLWELNSSFDHLCKTLENMSEYSTKIIYVDHEEETEHIWDRREAIKPYIIESYKKWILRKIGDNYYTFPPTSAYVFDRRCILPIDEERNTIVALSLYRTPRCLFVSKYLSLDY